MPQHKLVKNDSTNVRFWAYLVFTFLTICVVAGTVSSVLTPK